jgi:3-phenylpropionate/trans-cinnamate dioxygenase ferredoxin subunit
MASQRVDVGAVDAFLDGQARRVEVEGRGLVVVRRGAGFYALRDICPHQGARLSDGRVMGTTLECPPGAEIVLGREGEILSCPWHGWEFDVCTGRSLFGPEKVRVRAYSVGVESGRVLVELD